jgi:hypothetical protein
VWSQEASEVSKSSKALGAEQIDQCVCLSSIHWSPQAEECLPLVIFLKNRLKNTLTGEEVKKICMKCYVKIDASMAPTCNPSYTGGRDQEDHSSKPAWAYSSQDPILKKTII